MTDWLKGAAIVPLLDLNGETVPIVLRRHHSAKRLTLRLAPDGSEVRITLPRWARRKEAIAFAHARQNWLSDLHAKIPARSAPVPGGEIQFRGKPVCIKWDEAAPRLPNMEGNAVYVGGPKSGLEGRLRRWMEEEALSHAENDMRDYTRAAGLEPASVALTRAQKRWGSCSSKSLIRINWRLIQAPDFVRRSVVAHEVAHLVHFDHSRAFHALLDGIYEDDIAIANQWLKDHGRGLFVSFG